jgi:hypothetical protein
VGDELVEVSRHEAGGAVLAENFAVRTGAAAHVAEDLADLDLAVRP